ncbi:hypothetical protein HYC85_027604 [Camellia sinensis]|uniref:START domain-containing protein n=1 Tax=Camellia sinensis TaxID=4442 RepID=A0A7J7G859_CAMSI|nr:hypothetical protein HYC85_027604 [Camellia sinensis]
MVSYPKQVHFPTCGLNLINRKSLFLSCASMGMHTKNYSMQHMAAFNIQEALIWKEKVESVIDQYQESLVANGIKYVSFEYKSGIDNGRKSSSSDRDSQFSVPEDEEDDSHANFLWRTTTGNGPPESIFDWTAELDSDLIPIIKHSLGNIGVFFNARTPKSCSRAMRAVGVVEASCEEIFELVMSMDTTRWDCSFQYGSLVEEVDGHTAILYHRLQQDWFPMEHQNCDPQPGFVRVHLESGGFNISPLKPQNGRPRTQVQHLMQIDLKGWDVGYISSFQQHCLLQMLNNVAGISEYFSQTNERSAHPRIPVMVNMAQPLSSKKSQKLHNRSTSLEQC